MRWAIWKGMPRPKAVGARSSDKVGAKVLLEVIERIGRTMTDEIDESLDWLGNEVDCAYAARANALRGTLPLKPPVLRRYARRIDRFFNWNPDLANSYVTHQAFRGACHRSQTCDIFQLPRFLDDPEEAVRWNAARRLPKRYVLRYDGSHREVRIALFLFWKMQNLFDDVGL